MTDTAVKPGISAALDEQLDHQPEPIDELLSQNEVTPRSSAPVVHTPEPKTSPCPYCPPGVTVYRGGFRGAALANHKRKHHPAEYATEQEQKKGGAGAPKTTPAAKAPDKPDEKKDPPPKRVNAAATLGRIVGRAAQVLENIDKPVAKVLMFEAPSLGLALDDVVADTFVDRRIVQPMARTADKWERLGALVSLPVMIAVAERFPALIPHFEQELREAVEEILVAEVPLAKKRVERQRKAAAALAELRALDPEFAADPDPVGTLINSWLSFAPPPPNDNDPQNGQTE